MKSLLLLLCGAAAFWAGSRYFEDPEAFKTQFQQLLRSGRIGSSEGPQQRPVRKPAGACDFRDCRQTAGWEVRWSTLEAMDSAARRGRSITTTEWTERRCNDHQQTANNSGDVLRGARIINLEAVSPSPRGSIWDAMVEQNPDLGTKYRSLDEMIHHPELADPKLRAKRDAEERAMDALINLFPSRGNGRLR